MILRHDCAPRLRPRNHDLFPRTIVQGLVIIARLNRLFTEPRNNQLPFSSRVFLSTQDFCLSTLQAIILRFQKLLDKPSKERNFRKICKFVRNQLAQEIHAQYINHKKYISTIIFLLIKYNLPYSC